MPKTPLSGTQFRWTFIGWWITWSALHAWVVHALGYSWESGITDSIVANSLLAGACVLVSNNLQYYTPRKERYWYILGISLVLSFLWLLSVNFLLSVIPSPDIYYDDFVGRSTPIRFTLAFLLIGCMAIVSVLWYTFEEQKEISQRKADTERLAKEAELYKLRMQLQPHFLFNSLNSINALIGIQPAEARKMVQQLSDFLRGTLKKEEHQWIDLHEELEYLQLYLDIEKVRFGNRLSTVFNIDDMALQKKIPALLLQPLVENAIKFGLYDTTGNTVIRISATVINADLVISVENPFDPETSQPKHGTGFGLSSVQRRLFLLFARHDLVQTSVRENIFISTVTIPQL